MARRWPPEATPGRHTCGKPLPGLSSHRCLTQAQVTEAGIFKRWHSARTDPYWQPATLKAAHTCGRQSESTRGISRTVLARPGAGCRIAMSEGNWPWLTAAVDRDGPTLAA